MGPKRVVVKKKGRNKTSKQPTPSQPESGPRFLSAAPRGPAPGRALQRPQGGRKSKPKASRPANVYDTAPEYEEEPFEIGDVVPYLVILACLACVVLVFLPVNLSQVDGYDARTISGLPMRNLLRETQQKLLEEGPSTLSFSEEEVNAYLRRRVQGTHPGPLKLVSGVEGIYFDFQEKAATIYLVQRFLGLPFVVSSTWDYYIENQRLIRRCTASSLGRLRLNGILLGPLVMPFTEFAKACKTESSVLNLEGVQDIKLEPGVLRLEIRGKPSV